MNRRYIALALNWAALVCGLVGIGFRLARNVNDFFLYYTQLSNVVAVISSAIYILFSESKSEKTRVFVCGARYLGACGLTMTFAVVMFIFLPVGGEDAFRRLMSTVNGVLHHAVCPVLSVVSYLYFEDGVKSRKAVLIPFTATGIYAFTMYALNFLRLAEAPYPFFEVYEHEPVELVIWFFALMALVTGIAFAVRAVNLAVTKRRDGQRDG